MFWFIGFLFFCLYALSFKYAPQTHSDAVVVLTGGSNRIKTGLQLIQEKKADYLLISGVNKEVTKSKLFKNTSDDILNKINVTNKYNPVVRNLQLSFDEQNILSAIKGETHFDDIQLATKLDTKTLVTLLTTMELSGIIKKLAGNYYCK